MLLWWRCTNAPHTNPNFLPVAACYKKYDGHLWNYVDVTIKKRYEQSLEIEKTKYSSIIDNMNMGLLEVDNKDIIQLLFSIERPIRRIINVLILTESGL